MYAKKMMKVTQPTLYWSSCAPHTIDLMKNMRNLLKYMSVIEKAKSLVIFFTYIMVLEHIYASSRTTKIL